MKVGVVLLWMLLKFNCAFAQVEDNFEDSNLLIAPKWSGNLDKFQNVIGVLKSNSQELNSNFYISTEIETDKIWTWNLDCQLLFNPSSLNYIDVYLMADSIVLNNSKNALFVRLGGSTDEISLYKVSNGNSQKLIDGVNSTLNASNTSVNLQVIKNNDSLTLKYKLNNQLLYFTEGTVFDNTLQKMGYCGISIRQSTSSFFNKHVFDNLYFGLPVLDTIPPELLTIKCSSPYKIDLKFSEPIDSLILTDLVSSHCNCSPFEVTYLPGYSELSMKFNQRIDSNNQFKLKIKTVSDVFKNKTTSKDFNCIRYFTFNPIEGQIKITELMIDPEPAVGLPELEYIEIQNLSQLFLNLHNCRVKDLTSEYVIQNIVLAPDSFLLIFNGPSLNNSSDVISLLDSNRKLLQVINYTSNDYKDVKKINGGYSLEMIDPSQKCLKNDNWRASIDPSGGTPGRKNSVFAKLPKDTFAPVLLNVFSKENLLVLEFSESRDSLLSQLNFYLNGHPFLNQGKWTGSVLSFYLDEVLDADSNYYIKVNGISDCEGNIAQQQEKVIHVFTIPEKYDLVFNELLFNPFSGGKDFIELFQRSNRTFDLSEIFIADLNSAGTIQFMYPLTKDKYASKSNHYILLTEDTGIVCQQYNCGRVNAIPIKIAKLPSMPDDEAYLALVNIKGELIDSIFYNKSFHHPLYSDLNGVSLERLNTEILTHNKAIWYSASSRSGFATPMKRNSQFVNEIVPKQLFELQTKMVSPNMDGHQDVLVLYYDIGEPDAVCSVNVYSVNGKLVRHVVNNQTLGTQGVIQWDGLDDNGGALSTGIYILTIEGFMPNGNLFNSKFSVVLVNQ